MYTFESYKQEFLSQKQSFIPPMQILQPGEMAYSKAESGHHAAYATSEERNVKPKRTLFSGSSMPLKITETKLDSQENDQEGCALSSERGEDLADVLARLKNDKG